jgi:cellobiose transport system permease protein
MPRRNSADRSRTMKRPPLKLNRDTKGYFFILPYFLVLIALQLYPIIFTMGLSFTKPINMFENEFAGLENYRRLLTNPIFYQSIFNTLWIWLWNYIPQIIFAVLLAVILTTYKLKGREFLRTVYFLPNLVTAASIGVLFAVILDWKNGALNHVLVGMGILNEPFQWTVRPRIMQGAVSFIQWWQWFGYTMIIMMAGLNAISEDLYEAAYIDGASRKQAFFGVTLPLLRPTMLYVMITSLIGGMQIFDIPKVITRGRGQPDGALNTMVLYLYNQAFQNFNVGYAAAIAWVLFFIILIFSILSFRLIKGRD